LAEGPLWLWCLFGLLSGPVPPDESILCIVTSLETETSELVLRDPIGARTSYPAILTRNLKEV
jgi:hypothetical protein